MVNDIIYFVAGKTDKIGFKLDIIKKGGLGVVNGIILFVSYFVGHDI